MPDDIFGLGNIGIPTVDDSFPSQKAKKRTGEPYSMGDIGFGAKDDAGMFGLGNFGSSQPRNGKIYMRGGRQFIEDPRYPGSGRLVRLKNGRPVLYYNKRYGQQRDIFGSSRSSYGRSQPRDMFDLGSIGIPSSESISNKIRSEVRASVFYPKKQKQKESKYILPEDRQYKVRQAAPGIYAVQDPKGKLLDTGDTTKKEAYQMAHARNLDQFEDYQYESSRTNYDRAAEKFKKLRERFSRKNE